MIIGNREHAHAPLIVEAYKDVPAEKVALLLELTALNAANPAKDLPFALLEKAGIRLPEAQAAELLQKVLTIVSVFHENEITIQPLKAAMLIPAPAKLPLESHHIHLIDIRDTAFKQLSNATDGAGISPTQYYTHHQGTYNPAGGSNAVTPKKLPKDVAPLTITWPAITHVKQQWGKSADEVHNVAALADSSGLFFPYDNALKLQRVLRSDAIKNSGLIFGYAAAEPSRILEDGEVLKGLAAFYPRGRATRNIRKVLSLADGPAGGGL